MAHIVLNLVVTSTCFLVTFGANLPTVTVTNARRQSTIRFPENSSTTSERSSLLDVLPPNSTTTTTEPPSTIQPTKSTSSNVQIIGNYSVAVQHVSQEEDIVVKATPLLELLNILRQLPNEKLLEIYPKLLGEAENGGSFYQTSTESVLDFLNQIREQPKTTTTSSPVVITTTTKPSKVLTTASSPSNTLTSTTLSPITIEQTTKITTPVYETKSNESFSSTTPNATTTTTDSFLAAVTETATVTYEFTDYPPPLPPSLPEFPTIVKHKESESGGGASFAIGVAVGIFACVLVASTGVTWCVCRRHWGRRNVYATMERSEEMPRGLTKPGPPIILPSEFESSKRLSTTISKPENQNDDGCNRVTEL